MKIVNCTQGSEEWHKLREKRLTASHATAIGTCGKGLITYVDSLMQEYYSSQEKEHFSNKDTDRGNRYEPLAAFLYQIETGVEVKKIGFVEYNNYVGCSPDLYTNDNGLVEIKSPADKEYFRILQGGEVNSGYVWQMNCQMLICEKDYCDHVMYNPNYKKELIIKRFFPDQNKFEKLKEGFKIGERSIKEIAEKMDKILL